MPSFPSYFANPALGLIWKSFFHRGWSPERMRKHFEFLTAVSPEKLKSKYPNISIEASEISGIPVEIIQAVEGERPTLLYLHGGGYFMGSIAAYRRWAVRLSFRLGVRVILPEYRLAPENPHPAALEDSLLVCESIEDQNWILAGDSAGGGLTLATLMALRDQGRALPRSAIAISPLTDLTRSGESFRINRFRDFCITESRAKKWLKYYVGERDPKTPYISPCFGQFHGLPPIFFLVGDQEVLLDDSRRVVDGILNSGGQAKLKIYQGMQHDFMISLPFLRESRQSMRDMVEFISN